MRRESTRGQKQVDDVGDCWGKDGDRLLEKGCGDGIKFTLFGRGLHDKLGDFINVSGAKFCEFWWGFRRLRRMRRLVDCLNAGT